MNKKNIKENIFPMKTLHTLSISNFISTSLYISPIYIENIQTICFYHFYDLKYYVLAKQKFICKP